MGTPALIGMSGHPQVARLHRLWIEEDRDVVHVALVVIGVGDDRADRVAQRLERDSCEREVVERVEEPVLQAHQPVWHARIGARGSLGEVVEVELGRGERVEAGEVARPAANRRVRNSERLRRRDEAVCHIVHRSWKLDVIRTQAVTFQRPLSGIADGAVAVLEQARHMSAPSGIEHRDQGCRPEAVVAAEDERRLVFACECHDRGRVGCLDRGLGQRVRPLRRWGADHLRQRHEVVPAGQRVI